MLAAFPCADLPLAPGTSWTYRVEAAWSVPGSDSAGRQTFTWTTSVTSLKTSGRAAVAVVRGWPSELAWWTPGQSQQLSILYCSNGHLYQVTPAGHEQIAPLAESLLGATRRPTPEELLFVFPLHSGQLFGRDSLERDDSFYAWYTESAEPLPAAFRRFDSSLSDSVFHLAYRTSQIISWSLSSPGLG